MAKKKIKKVKTVKKVPKKAIVKKPTKELKKPKKTPETVKATLQSKKQTAKELEDEATALLLKAEKDSKPPVETANYYFGDKEEEMFLLFVNSEDKHERDLLYNKWLKKPFQKMVESILRKYPIHIGNYDIKEVEENGLSHLIEHMGKFDPTRLNKEGKKVKAFSYCQTIVRNYFRDHGKRSYAEKTSNLSYDDFSSEIENMKEYTYEMDISNDLEMKELMDSLIIKLKEKLVEDKSLRKNEIIVGEAIINVLECWDVLFLEETRHGKYNKRVTNNYTKNKILLLLKEQTRLSTKDIRASMKQFKELYFINKRFFFSEEDDD